MAKQRTSESEILILPGSRRNAASVRYLKRVGAAGLAVALVASGYVVPRPPDSNALSAVTEDTEAMQAYLRGAAGVRAAMPSVDQLRAAEEALEYAAARDTVFAQAFALLAVVRARLATEHGLLTERGPARGAIRRAIDLAPRSPTVRRARRIVERSLD